MQDFFVNYLREYGGTPENQLYPKSEELVRETLPFVPVSHFFWGVWGLLQVELSPVGFGFAVGIINFQYTVYFRSTVAIV